MAKQLGGIGTGYPPDVASALADTQAARKEFHQHLPPEDLATLEHNETHKIRDYYQHNVISILEPNVQKSPKFFEMKIRNIQHQALEIAKESIIPRARKLLETDVASLHEQLKHDQQLQADIAEQNPPLSDLSKRIREAMLKDANSIQEFDESLTKRALEILLNNPPPNTSGIKSPLIREGVGTFPGASTLHSDLSKSVQDLENLLLDRPEQNFESNLTYYKVKESIESQINSLVNALKIHITPEKRNKITDGHRSGHKINLNRAMMLESDPSLYDTIWHRRLKVATRRSVCFSILLDLSGSMQYDNKIQNALSALVLISEALTKLEIPFAISGFNVEKKEIKNFDESVQERMVSSIGELEEITVENWANHDGKFLMIAAEEMNQRDEHDKFLIVISDGDPVGQYTDGEKELKDAISIVESMPNGPVLIGLGIGAGTDHVTKYYAHSHANIPVSEITSRLSQIIHALILG